MTLCASDLRSMDTAMRIFNVVLVNRVVNDLNQSFIKSDFFRIILGIVVRFGTWWYLSFDLTIIWLYIGSRYYGKILSVDGSKIDGI